MSDSRRRPLGKPMNDGYYWIKDGERHPEVWLYQKQFGWFRPCSAVPMPQRTFELMKYVVLSERLEEPARETEC
ncbi:hypothetical protein MXF26_07160 [Pantoea dispersa]|uniref:hypothetical protein n=1 Tax=Pantoea dispersa TaxID=59814 RepID=UPI002DB7D2DE|nr:hypothetical protein [Pantoea dispersa]MEB5836036.1 hypothetical protein [Pantoea dispersa]